MPRLLILALFLAAATAARAGEPTTPRVERLLATLSLEEKVGQLTMDSPGGTFDPKLVTSGALGSVLNFFEPADAERLARLGPSNGGVPLLQALDIIHGYRTITPVPVAEAATFEPHLAEAAAELAAREARASGIHLTFAPVADIARDPRWGRALEGSGEDPLMGRLFTTARVKGFHKGGLATTLKHFAGYGAVEGGRDYDAADMSPTRFANTYLPPYRAAIEAGTDAVMTAYITRNGLPATADKALLTDLLRRDWGFEGVVMSDYNSVGELVSHGVARNDREAALKAFRAGVDIDMQSDVYRRELPGLVRSGAISMADLDRSVRRVLMLKEKLGLFEAPIPDAKAAEAQLVTPAARDLARKIARDSFVLLKNDGDLLPLKPDLKRVAVIGWLADDQGDTIGPHGGNGHNGDVVTLLAGIRNRVGPGTEVVFEPACGALCTDRSAFLPAVKAAAEADVTVLVLGEARRLSGEAASRSQIDLPGLQEELVARIAATGKPVVLLLFNGRPLALESVAKKVPALMTLWYPGIEGGNAVADVLFGDAAPSGRLPFTFPRTVGQIPLTYDHLPTGRPGNGVVHDSAKYQDIEVGPLYPFGHGLTYTRFAYSDLGVLTPVVSARGGLAVEVTVTNTGARAGREVAQLYLNQTAASISRPVRELKSFAKIALQPGESRRLRFEVPASELGFTGADGVFRVEPGPFRLWAGGSAAANLEGAFELVDENMVAAQ